MRWRPGTHPPAADGRWTLTGGTVVSLLLKRAPDGSGQTIALFGRYEIEDGAFSYGYDGGSMFMQRPGGIGDPYPVPFGEVRRYEARREGSRIVLAMADGTAEFRIEGDFVEYCEAGKIMRRWRRIATG